MGYWSLLHNHLATSGRSEWWRGERGREKGYVWCIYYPIGWWSAMFPMNYMHVCLCTSYAATQNFFLKHVHREDAKIKDANIIILYYTMLCLNTGFWLTHWYLLNPFNAQVVPSQFNQNQNELYCQVCLHIRGICFRDKKLPKCNRMTVTEQNTDNKERTLKYNK